jgi:hypothetical protein
MEPTGTTPLILTKNHGAGRDTNTNHPTGKSCANPDDNIHPNGKLGTQLG